MGNKNWYALHVTTGFEKSAHENLLEQISRKGMELAFGEILLPTKKKIGIRKGQKVEREERMYPGYLFLEMEMSSECWHLVRRTRWVNGFIGGSSESPRALSEEEINSIRERIDAGANRPTFDVRFSIGEQARIKGGPFADFSGVIESLNNERERLTVSVMIFGRSTPVELDFDEVEKI